MLKILSTENIRKADKYTIENEPIANIDLMERAAGKLLDWITKHISSKNKIRIICGTGNNGGDGLALARLLSEKGYCIQVDLAKYSDKLSDNNKINLKKLETIKRININTIEKNNNISEIDADEIIIDALFGSGLSRPVETFPSQIIEKINNSHAMVISIDVPSGLFCDTSNKSKQGSIVRADYTLTFQNPKLAFLFAENDRYVGQWEILDINLHPDFLKNIASDDIFIDINDIRHILKQRSKFSHKGTFGHALLISGSYGKMGAAVLASQACLRSGAGLLTTHIPKAGYQILQSTIPEAMISIDENEEYFTKINNIGEYNAIGIGPGIGQNKKTQNALKLLIQNSLSPLLFDADAINILGENKTWLSFVPKESIFTPHPKEFERITKKSKNDFERHSLQREFSIKYGVYVILKGAHTAISCPNGKIYFNTTGNPGMATAGSGDVLTGILLGLMAQNYHPRDVTIVGAFLHGLAGDLAIENQSMESMIAGDIIKDIGKAYIHISQKNFPLQ
ncbi:MAG: NAD(P)H-hydrate dehydratase [Bacteroidota bacterium]|nr:NAD(P)H-hydrate dehydratase [Bacteroidota bacterium]